MLAVAAFVAFVIAGILHLVKLDPGAVTWLIIAGGLLVSAAVAWGWAGPLYRRGRTAP